MSHLVTRLFAERLADPDEGVNSIVQEMASILHANDPLPSTEIFIYDDTRDGWVARGLAPSDSLGIEYPCIRVRTISVDVESGVPHSATDSIYVEGTIRLGAQLLLQQSDEVDAVIAGMYILRAMRGVVVRWDDPDNANTTSRLTCGVKVGLCQSVSQGTPDWPLGDNVVSPGTLLLTYAFSETVPLPTALH